MSEAEQDALCRSQIGVSLRYVGKFSTLSDGLKINRAIPTADQLHFTACVVWHFLLPWFSVDVVAMVCNRPAFPVTCLIPHANVPLCR